MKQFNNWSCMACVAAMIVNEPLQNVIDFIGHDGSDWDPNSKSPFRVVGFSVFEIISFLASRNLMLGFYALITGSINFEDKDFLVTVPIDAPAMITVKSERFFPNVRHVVYWDGKKVFDPNPEVEDGRSLKNYKIYEWWPILKFK